MWSGRHAELSKAGSAGPARGPGTLRSLPRPRPAPRTDHRDRRPIPADARARVLLALAIGVYVALFAGWTMRNHDGFGTQAFDFAIYDQGLWLLSRLETPFVTVMGRHLFGDHTSFILLPLVPVYWLLPSAKVLLVTQAAALGLAALPAFLVGREVLRRELPAALVAVAYLLHPAVGWTNLEQFHPDVFEVPLALFVVWFALRRRWVPYFVCLVALLAVKEDVPLLTFAVGIWVAARGDRRVGLATCALSALYLAVAMWWVLPGLNGVGSLNGWRIPFGGVKGLLATSVTDPTRVAAHLVDGARPWYLWQLIAPLGLVPLLAPGTLLLAAGPLASNLVSTFGYQHDIRFHYSTLLLPVLVVATVAGVARFRTDRWRTVVAAAVLASAVASAHAWGPTPLWRDEPYLADPSHPMVEHLRRAKALIPDEAVVSAFYGFLPHVAHRERVYMFPNPWRASFWGVFDREGERLPLADDVEWVFVPSGGLSADDKSVLDVVRAEFRTVYEEGGVTLLQRRAGAVRGS